MAEGRFLIPRILFSMIWHVGLDRPSNLMRVFPVVRIYSIVKKFLHLQKDIGLYSAMESRNRDQISLAF